MLRQGATTGIKRNNHRRNTCYGLPDTGWFLSPYSGRSVAYLSLGGRCYATAERASLRHTCSNVRFRWLRTIFSRIPQPTSSLVPRSAFSVGGVTSNHVTSAHRESYVIAAIGARSPTGEARGKLRARRGTHLGALRPGRPCRRGRKTRFLWICEVVDRFRARSPESKCVVIP